MRDDLNLDSTFVYESTGQAGQSEALPVTIPFGTIFVSGINGISGNVTFSGGSTGLTFGAAGATVSLSGTLAIANGGTGATSASAARTGLGIDDIATKKSNLSATVAPTVNEDSGDGYAVGSLWVDVTGDQVYMAVDVTVGAAVWKQLSV